MEHKKAPFLDAAIRLEVAQSLTRHALSIYCNMLHRERDALLVLVQEITNHLEATAEDKNAPSLSERLKEIEIKGEEGEPSHLDVAARAAVDDAKGLAEGDDVP